MYRGYLENYVQSSIRHFFLEYAHVRKGLFGQQSKQNKIYTTARSDLGNGGRNAQRI